jgi:hypothetical protein
LPINYKRDDMFRSEDGLYRPKHVVPFVILWTNIIVVLDGLCCYLTNLAVVSAKCK